MGSCHARRTVLSPPVPRPFRFGLQASAPPAGTSWTDLARRAEADGWSVLTVADHLDAQYAPIPAIQAAADATTTLRVGALVLCNDYRHPVVAAKELATIDVLSRGRLEAGLGAGWMTSDYEHAGLPLDRAGVRVDRMLEALDVIDALWGDAPATYDGVHYTVSGLDGRPKPVQRPRPPLLIGGGGRRVLSIAGARADIVGININLAKGVIDADAGPDGTAERTDEKVAWVRDAAGARFDRLELQVRVHLVLVTDDRAAMADALAGGFGLTPAAALASPHSLVGTVEQIADDLVERRERWGISYIGVSLDAMEAMRPIVARLTGT
jgi:probable F420-dependent oxidoreductase